jgi:hypothetical protein
MKKFHRNDLKLIYYPEHKRYYPEEIYLSIIRKEKIKDVLNEEDRNEGKE